MQQNEARVAGLPGRAGLFAIGAEAQGQEDDMLDDDEDLWREVQAEPAEHAQQVEVGVGGVPGRGALFGDGAGAQGQEDMLHDNEQYMETAREFRDRRRRSRARMQREALAEKMLRFPRG